MILGIFIIYLVALAFKFGVRSGTAAATTPIRCKPESSSSGTRIDTRGCGCKTYADIGTSCATEKGGDSSRSDQFRKSI